MKAKEEQRLAQQRRVSQQILEAQRYENAMKKKEKAEQAFINWLKTKQFHTVSL